MESGIPCSSSGTNAKPFSPLDPKETPLGNNIQGGLGLGAPKLSFAAAMASRGATKTRPPVNASRGGLTPTASVPSDKSTFSATTCSGQKFNVAHRVSSGPQSFVEIIEARSTHAPGRAKKSYYGIDIHKLIDDAAKEKKRSADHAEKTRAEIPRPSVEQVANAGSRGKGSGRTLLWSEKYRAKQFTDLIGDERTHRAVLRWVKGWDPIVFPNHARPKPMSRSSKGNDEEQKVHRKILILTGPPGFGKTTLAHVAARQAGYEVLEINASDERSKDIVNGRIRDIVGTENVRGISVKSINGKSRKAGKPVCVVVDEVDGVVGGSSGGAGGGEGGFMKALIDLILLDQKNVSDKLSASTTGTRKKGKSENFRLLRPIILVCNDVYHPSLRPLRQSSLAEIIHIRKPPLNMIVTRMQNVFTKEGIPCDGDGVRRLCEAAWGVNSRRDAKSNCSSTGEGDIRGIMVVGEWVARKLRASSISDLSGTARLTRKWVEQHILSDLGAGGSAARSLGRGGVKDVVDRVFLEGAGFPKTENHLPVKDLPTTTGYSHGIAHAGKQFAMNRLKEMIDTTGEHEKVITDCFSAYPSHNFQDDTFLSKPNSAYEWLHFHDALSSKISHNQEWELAPYLGHPVLAFHHLFASPARRGFVGDFGKNSYAREGEGEDEEKEIPFSGPRADFSAYEAQKQSKSVLLALQNNLSSSLLRSFRSPEEIATDLVPYLNRMLTPDVKPVVVGGSGDQRGIASVRKEREKEMVQKSVGVMHATGINFERGRIEADANGRSGGWVYRMEP